MLNNDIISLYSKDDKCYGFKSYYVNRKVSPIDKGQKPDQEHPEGNFGAEPTVMGDMDGNNE